MRSKGIKIQDISFIVSRDRKTVSLWLKDFSTQKMASIFTGHEDNQNAGKLTKEQKQEIHSCPVKLFCIPKIALNKAIF